MEANKFSETSGPWKVLLDASGDGDDYVVSVLVHVRQPFNEGVRLVENDRDKMLAEIVKHPHTVVDCCVAKNGRSLLRRWWSELSFFMLGLIEADER